MAGWPSMSSSVERCRRPSCDDAQASRHGDACGPGRLVVRDDVEGPWRASRQAFARGRRCPHRPVPPGLWSAGVGARTSPQQTTHAGVAGGCAGLLEGFAHATESRAPASGVAPTPWCAATPSARDCKQNGADTRRAGPGKGIELAEVPTTATGRQETMQYPCLWRPVRGATANDMQQELT